MSTVAIAAPPRPFGRDPGAVALVRPLLKLVNAYFATEFRGWEHVPRDGPFLIVGNHSGGAESNDFAFLLHKWVEERGVDAALYGLTYDMLFSVPLLSSALRQLGLIPANHDNGGRALALGAAVSVFPGGDYEVFRPWSERNRIDFGGRMGFVSLAITSRVPVVPMTIHGAHQSTLVLTRGRRFAEAMGLNRLRVKVYPLIWNIPFGPTPASVPSLQLPSKVTVHFGAPLDWSRYRPSQARDPAVQRACYDEITGRMQKTLTRLAHEHPYPLLERLRALGSDGTLPRLAATPAQYDTRASSVPASLRTTTRRDVHGIPYARSPRRVERMQHAHRVDDLVQRRVDPFLSRRGRCRGRSGR